MERSGVFLVFPTSSSHCRSPTGRSFNWFKRSASIYIAMTGPSHAACNIHWAWSTLPVRSLSRCSPTVLYHCSEDLPLNCCNCSAAGRAQRLEWVRSLNPPATFLSILSRNVQLSTNDGAFARRLNVKRYTHDRREKFATPKSIFFTCPNISHVWKLEKPTTTTLNSKKER